MANAIDSIDLVSNTTYSDVDIFAVAINFVACVAVSFIARSFYVNYSTSLSGKNHIATIIPILATIVFLVILVVKSSLALSLGLVGALSIVRFRTPIKDPEELVYLFLAIAIGLGYAAGHTVLTTAITLSILAMIYFWLSNRKVGKTGEYNLVINWKHDSIQYETIVSSISALSQSVKLIRLDRGPITNSVVLALVPTTDIRIDDVTNALRELDEGLDISFYEANANW